MIIVKGTLYLNYYKNQGASRGVRFSISETNPEYSNRVQKLEGLFPPKLLESYFDRESIEWSVFRERYFEFLITSEKAQEDISKIVELLNSGIDVSLFTWKKSMPCYKFIIGQLLLTMGFNVVELNGLMSYEYEDNSYLFEKGNTDPEYVKFKKGSETDVL